MLKKLIKTIIPLIICNSVFTIAIAKNEISNQKFVSYSTKDGLSSSKQSSIVQDKEGFIWIGTTDGLNRFDGYSFKVYRKIQGDSTSLNNNSVNALFVDSKGTLWIGMSRGGLCRYNRDYDNFSNYSFERDNTVTSIVEDRYKRLWVATYTGLNYYDSINNKFIKFESDSQKLNPALEQIRSLYLDGDILWSGYAAGYISALNITSLKSKYYRIFNSDSKNTTDYFITSICTDSGKLWISTWGKGVWLFDKTTHNSERLDKLKYAFVNSIRKDKKGNLWIGTESDGLLFLDIRSGKTVHFIHDDYNKYSLSNNCISYIYIDNQDNIWLCSKKGALHFFLADNPFQYWQRNPLNEIGLSSNNITCMLESDHKLFIGYLDGGIDILNLITREKKTIRNQNGLGDGTIITMFNDKEGNIWIGTYLNGLKKYNKNSGQFITYQHSENNLSTISGNDVRRIAEDNKGNLWLAIHGGGLNKFDKKTGKAEHFKVYYPDLSKSLIASDWLLTVLIDKSDNIWVGSVSGASFISSDHRIIRHFSNNIKDPESISNDNVNVIFEDSNSDIWFGTNEGLNLYNKKTGKFKRFSTENDLPDNIIVGILEDNKQNLWISTNKGLSVFSKKTSKFKNYSVDDGLISDEFNLNSCFKNKKGEMYFGGLEGLNFFNPDSIKINNVPPPVYITDFKLFNNSVPVKSNLKKASFTLNKIISKTKEIILSYNQNVLGFEFVALNYNNLYKNLYSYKLEGFDENWSKPGKKRDATYTNLQEGTYIFRVKACNNDGIWNNTGTSLIIKIKPPYWKTNWALMIYIFLILALLYIFRLLILRDANIKRKLEFETLEVVKLQEMDEQKMRFFSNISHEFRTPLTLIMGPLEKLLNNNNDESQQLNLKLIQRNAQRLLRLINQLMDFRKIEKSELENNYFREDIIQFINDLANSFVYEAKQRNISFSVNSESESLVIYFDRDKMDKILYNLISNAFKFTQNNGSITIWINTDENLQNLIISVEDTGIGIPSEAQPKIFERFYQVKNTGTYGTGIGLSLTKDLIQILNGSINVESAPGKGSKFTVLIPIRKEPENNYLSEKNIDQTTNEKKENALWNYHDLEESGSENMNVEKLPILLIVEDNIDMRLYIKSEFINLYHIIEAENGLIGLEKAFSEIPDIIISDVMMPEIDGIEFCKKIKTEEKTSHIPVILLTARTSDANAIEGLESGADDYIIKPFNAPILRIKVRNIVESRKLIQNKFLKEPEAKINEIVPTALDEKFINKAIEIVEKNLDNGNLDTLDFVSAMGMSRAQVYRKIQALTGQSVKEFIRVIRLKKAAKMIVSDKKNISEIAFAVGFNSVAYFTKSFTDYYGVSPSKYIHRKETAD